MTEMCDAVWFKHYYLWSGYELAKMRLVLYRIKMRSEKRRKLSTQGAGSDG